MKEITLNNTQVTLYTSIKELPIEVSKKLQHYLLQVIGIGNSIEEADEHLARLMEFLKSDKKDDAIEEVKNLRYNLFTMLSEWDFRSLSFACLVKEVNGKPLKDYSPEGLNKIVVELSEAGFTQGMVQDTMDEIKKNLIRNGNSIFLSSLEKTQTISDESGIF